MVPHTGARLQYIIVLEAGWASLSWGSRGLERNFCATEELDVLRGARVLFALPVDGTAADDAEAARFTAVTVDADPS